MAKKVRKSSSLTEKQKAQYTEALRHIRRAIAVFSPKQKNSISTPPDTTEGGRND